MNKCPKCGSPEVENIKTEKRAKMCTVCGLIYRVELGRIRVCVSCGKQEITFSGSLRCDPCREKYMRSSASASTGCMQCGRSVTRTSGYRGPCICDECAH